jgi:nitrous oxidase accessory protein NosD
MSLAQLFYCREAIRSRVKRWRERRPRTTRNRFMFEALEPRLLLSATPTEIIAPQELTTAAVSVSAGSLPSLDVDLNGQADALSDGIVIIRHLFGFTGNALTDGAVDPSGQRADPTAIQNYLNSLGGALDIDLNQSADALSDGIMIIRSLFGFTGTALTDGVVDPLGQRTDPDAIASFLNLMNPAFDRTPPTITVGLLHDTGVSATDGVTFDPTITGQAIDLSGISSLKAGFGTSPASSFFDLTGDLQPDGSFRLDRLRLAEIHQGALVDGTYRLRLIAADRFLQESSETEVVFTLGSQVPGAPTLGAIEAYSTIYSIGVEWPIVGDTDHDAEVDVSYRLQGTSMWREGFSLARVDFNGFDMLAGSLFFLDPGASYEVKLNAFDPEGLSETRIVTVATRAVPTLPTVGRTFHVMPGTGAGDGSVGNPFRGITAAQNAAQPGDILLLHAGNYGGRVIFNKDGLPGNYLVWKAAGDGEVSFNGIAVAADHVWFEGITIRNLASGLSTANSPRDVVVTRSGFSNNHYSIDLRNGGADWYITDNVIVGDTPVDSGGLSGEGIELWHTSGHTVAYNSISLTADGISYPDVNVDIFGNDIFDTADDGIEGDYGYANVRIWGNRIHNAVHNGISFQDMNGAPWYLIRNQIIGNQQSAYKFRITDQFFLFHNTIVQTGGIFDSYAEHLLNSYSRNNLYVSINGGRIWAFDRIDPEGTSLGITWKTDLDYDGFDWGTFGTPFVFDGTTFSSLALFAGATGLESHGIRMNYASCFENLNVPGFPPVSVPPQTLTLKADCNAIDAGAIVSNVNDGFTGMAPDLGAFEFGVPLLQFGPRPLALVALSNMESDLVKTLPPADTRDGSSSCRLTVTAPEVVSEQATAMSLTDLSQAYVQQSWVKHYVNGTVAINDDELEDELVIQLQESVVA